MEGFKDFYNNRNGKMILFFGFYLIFFIFLAFYIRGLDNNKNREIPKEEENIKEEITTYDISQLWSSLVWGVGIKLWSGGTCLFFRRTYSHKSR